MIADNLPTPRGAGWPWTREGRPEQEAGWDASPWPRITVVTPSCNQAPFIEETIRSVLLQGYPDLEYIIIDGGSTDGSVEIIRRYEPWLSFWVSEPDRGQSHALNKGFERATGDIITWLCSDDVFLPGALQNAALSFDRHPDAGLIYGDCLLMDETGAPLGPYPWTEDFDLERLVYVCDFIPQPAAFFRADVFRAVGPIDESLHNCMDYDLWIRIGQRFPVQRVPGTFATVRWYADAKTRRCLDRRWQENLALAQKYGDGRASRERLGNYHQEFGARAFQQHDGRTASAHLLRAVWQHPRLLGRRGVRAMLVKSLWRA